ncbi:MAG: hypothetical protein C4542_02940 [Dehalococcoidia bacterium]|nr:MAG: hypothetical protein C4542_02940 [Dehalococcoidia bacterium]
MTNWKHRIQIKDIYGYRNMGAGDTFLSQDAAVVARPRGGMMSERNDFKELLSRCRQVGDDLFRLAADINAAHLAKERRELLLNEMAGCFSEGETLPFISELVEWEYSTELEDKATLEREREEISRHFFVDEDGVRWVLKRVDGDNEEDE